jgi:hypothetical protein
MRLVTPRNGKNNSLGHPGDFAHTGIALVGSRLAALPRH